MLAAGMRPITLNKEIDGFILNRLQFTLVAEALHLVGEGYCSAGGYRCGADGRARLALGFDRPVRGGAHSTRRTACRVSSTGSAR